VESGTAQDWKSIRFGLICSSLLTAKENAMEKAREKAICMPRNNFIALSLQEIGAFRENVFGSCWNVLKFNLTSTGFGVFRPQQVSL